MDVVSPTGLPPILPQWTAFHDQRHTVRNEDAANPRAMKGSDPEWIAGSSQVAATTASKIAASSSLDITWGTSESNVGKLKPFGVTMLPERTPDDASMENTLATAL